MYWCSGSAPYMRRYHMDTGEMADSVGMFGGNKATQTLTSFKDRHTGAVYGTYQINDQLFLGGMGTICT